MMRIDSSQVSRTESFHVQEVDLQRLLTRLSPRLAAVRRRFGLSAEAASDALQEVLVRYTIQSRAIECPERWLIVVFANECRRHLARRALVERSERQFLRERPDECPFRRDSGVVQAMAVRSALTRLSARERLMIACRFRFELTEPQIAARLGISAGSVKKTVARAVARLRSLLRR